MLTPGQRALVKLLRMIQAAEWCFQHGSVVIQDPQHTLYRMLVSDPTAYSRHSTHAQHLRKARRANGTLIYGNRMGDSRKQMAIDLPPTSVQCRHSARPVTLRTAVFEKLPDSRLFIKPETYGCKGLFCWRSGFHGALHAVEAVRALTGLRPKNRHARKEHGGRHSVPPANVLANGSYANNRMAKEVYVRNAQAGLLSSSASRRSASARVYRPDSRTRRRNGYVRFRSRRSKS